MFFCGTWCRHGGNTAAREGVGAIAPGGNPATPVTGAPGAALRRRERQRGRAVFPSPGGGMSRFPGCVQCITDIQFRLNGKSRLKAEIELHNIPRMIAKNNGWYEHYVCFLLLQQKHNALNKEKYLFILKYEKNYADYSKFYPTEF